MDKLIATVKRETLEKCRLIEALPPPDGDMPMVMSQHRYPLERGLTRYEADLPGLHETLQSLPAQASVLDIGAGRGKALHEIKQEYKLQAVGIGLPDTPDLLYQDYSAALASDLPFPDNSFDLVISLHGISWESDQKRAINEVLRVLKPDGVAILAILPFSHSIFVWFSDQFWDEIGVNHEAYRAGYEINPQDYVNNAQISVEVFDISDTSPQYPQAFLVTIGLDANKS